MKRLLIAGSVFLVLVISAVALAWLLAFLRPATPATGEPRAFEIDSGDGLRSISQELEARGLIRSAFAFQVHSFFTGRARALQPGRYDLDPGLSSPKILALLVEGPELETTITIPEGFTAADIDALLVQSGVISETGAFLELVRVDGLEGRLFPDTYRFYFDSTPRRATDRFLENFDRLAAPILAADPENAARNLVLASMLEKEVPDYEDRRVVAGILLKRAAAGMPLQVDATICYIKEQIEPQAPCEPITALDKKIDSPYNTYLNSGWPPGAISNPGVLAIKAALDPVESPYWYYLSDPETGRTIFAKTLEEHSANRLKYLMN